MSKRGFVRRKLQLFCVYLVSPKSQFIKILTVLIKWLMKMYHKFLLINSEITYIRRNCFSAGLWSRRTGKTINNVVNNLNFEENWKDTENIKRILVNEKYNIYYFWAYKKIKSNTPLQTRARNFSLGQLWCQIFRKEICADIETHWNRNIACILWM